VSDTKETPAPAAAPERVTPINAAAAELRRTLDDLHETMPGLGAVVLLSLPATQGNDVTFFTNLDTDYAIASIKNVLEAHKAKDTPEGSPEAS